MVLPPSTDRATAALSSNDEAPPLFAVQNMNIVVKGLLKTPLIKNVSFELHKGEALGLVGESGSGKSITCWSSLGLPPRGVTLSVESMQLDGQIIADDKGLDLSAYRDIRGKRIAMIFQDPIAALNPVRRIGSYIRSLLKAHLGLVGDEATIEAVRLLDAVGIPQAKARLGSYPHELSGGQCQRVMIAGALSGQPDIIIADEPTTALDVTTRAQIIGLIDDLRKERGLGLILVSHDLGVVAEAVDRVAVMHQGEIVETGPVESVFSNPTHAYTKQLLDSMPPEEPPERDPFETEAVSVVECANITKVFLARGGLAEVKALSSVSLDVQKGETIGLVGESGSGKTTLGRILAGLDMPTEGTLSFSGNPVLTKQGKDFRRQRQQIQYVFQDPMSALNARLTVETQVAEGIRLHQSLDWATALEKARDFLERVGVDRAMAGRYVHQLSGGQRQRAVIARSLILEPEFVVFDEPVSALDLSIQAQVLDLIDNLKKDFDLTTVFISHDLSVVRYVSDRIAVLYHGEIVEFGDAEQIFTDPQHDYTRELLASVPKMESVRSATAERMSGIST